MSPRKVDKNLKRREVAKASLELFHEIGIKKITVAQVAKEAGIGKGTIYEYFENKEDIVFEIINIIIENYHENFQKEIQDVHSTKKKIYHFFKFVLDDSENSLTMLRGYQEYLSVHLSQKNTKMEEFNAACDSFFREKLHSIVQEGIQNNELIPEAINFVDGLISYEKGLVLQKLTNPSIDINAECTKLIESLFDLLEK